MYYSDDDIMRFSQTTTFFSPSLSLSLLSFFVSGSALTQLFPNDFFVFFASRLTLSILRGRTLYRVNKPSFLSSLRICSDRNRVPLFSIVCLLFSFFSFFSFIAFFFFFFSSSSSSPSSSLLLFFRDDLFAGVRKRPPGLDSRDDALLLLSPSLLFHLLLYFLPSLSCGSAEE